MSHSAHAPACRRLIIRSFSVCWAEWQRFHSCTPHTARTHSGDTSFHSYQYVRGSFPSVLSSACIRGGVTAHAPPHGLKAKFSQIWKIRAHAENNCSGKTGSAPLAHAHPVCMSSTTFLNRPLDRTAFIDIKDTCWFFASFIFFQLVCYAAPGYIAHALCPSTIRLLGATRAGCNSGLLKYARPR